MLDKVGKPSRPTILRWSGRRRTRHATTCSAPVTPCQARSVLGAQYRRCNYVDNVPAAIYVVRAVEKCAQSATKSYTLDLLTIRGHRLLFGQRRDGRAWSVHPRGRGLALSRFS